MKTISKDTVVFFHEGTLNGKAGAYAAWQTHQEHAHFEGIDYSTLENLHLYDLTDKTVYIIGLSIASKHLDPIMYSASKIIFIDHHKTSMNIQNEIPDVAQDKFQLIHSTTRASCCLSWKHFVDERPVPELFLAIEDMEMRSQNPRVLNSLFICTGLSVHFDFISLNTFFQNNLERLKDSEAIGRLINDGRAYFRFVESLVHSYVNKASFFDMIDKQVPVLNIPKTFVTPCLNILCSKAGIALSYIDSENKRFWSIRTHQSSKLDASRIAGLLDGGGSTHVGGFTTSTSVTPEELAKKFRQALSETVNKDIIKISE